MRRPHRRESILDNLPDFLWFRPENRRYTFFAIAMVMVSIGVWTWIPRVVAPEWVSAVCLGIIAVMAVSGALLLARRRRP